MQRIGLRTLRTVSNANRIPSQSRLTSQLYLPTRSTMSASSSLPRFIDIAVNLTDPMFKGEYRGKKAHESDVDAVLERAKKAGVVAQIITGDSAEAVREGLEMCAKAEDLFVTVGCHPTRSGDFESHPGGPQGYLDELSGILDANSAKIHGKQKGKAICLGECGLDYDRLEFASADLQKKYFDLQLTLVEKYGLPIFLHCRGTCVQDFVDIMAPRMDAMEAAIGRSGNPPPSLPAGAASNGHSTLAPPRRVGVVHSFTGTIEEMELLVSHGLFIGLNGCSLKTTENLQLVKALPLERLILETDAPWCDLRSTHASAEYLNAETFPKELEALYRPASAKKEKHSKDKMIKTRNEPCTMGQVAAVVAAVKGLPLQTLAEIAENNTRWLFGL